MNLLNITTLNPEKLSQLFKERTDKWPHPIMYKECYTIGLFDDFSDETTGTAAFKLIPVALEIALSHKKSSLFPAALSLLDTLVRLSNTTEQPLELTERWSELITAMESHQENSYVKITRTGLREWYRLK